MTVDLTIKIMVVYFVFITLFGDFKDKTHAAIIFIACMLFVLFPLATATSKIEHISNKENYLFYDAATALILTLTLKIDKTSWKQALLLAFAMLCHIMILLHLITDFYYAWAISLPFYSHYKELIIMVGILQMAISHNGLISALRNVRGYLLWFSFNCWCYSKSFTASKEGAT